MVFDHTLSKCNLIFKMQSMQQFNVLKHGHHTAQMSNCGGVEYTNSVGMFPGNWLGAMEKLFLALKSQLVSPIWMSLGTVIGDPCVDIFWIKPHFHNSKKSVFFV